MQYFPDNKTSNFVTKLSRTLQLYPVYRLQDYVEDEIESVFYAEELQKVRKSDDIYRIEKILAEKKENGKVKVFVEWLEHDKKFNNWIPKSEL